MPFIRLKSTSTNQWVGATDTAPRVVRANLFPAATPWTTFSIRNYYNHPIDRQPRNGELVRLLSGTTGRHIRTTADGQLYCDGVLGSGSLVDAAFQIYSTPVNVNATHDISPNQNVALRSHLNKWLYVTSDNTVRGDSSALGAGTTFTMEQGQMWAQLTTLKCDRTEDVLGADEPCIVTYNLPYPGREIASSGLRLDSLNNGQDT
jgi:hypothetical protein